MPRVKTLDRVAAITATLHDGTSMIVLTKDKPVRFAASALELLEKKRALHPEGYAVEAPASEGDRAESDDVFEVPEGYAVTEKGGGWYEISGPDGFEPVSARGADGVREKLAGLNVAEAADEADEEEQAPA